jgi:hypothetical protein
MQDPTTQTAQSPLAKLVKDVVMVQWFDDHSYKITFIDGSERSFVSASTVSGGVFALDWLPRYRGQVGNDQADQELHIAGHRGTQVHHAIYTLCKPGLVMFDHAPEINVNPDLREKVTNLVAQCKANDVPYYVVRDQFNATLVNRYKKLHAVLGGKPLNSEMVVYSLTHETAGTLDQERTLEAGARLAEDGTLVVNVPTTGIWILDFKTGAEDEAHKLQVAAYLVCLEESKRVHVEGFIICYLNGKNKKGIAGVKCVLRTREQALEEDFPDFLRAKALWHRGHPNWEPKVAEFEAIMYLPDITEAVPSGFTLPNETAEEVVAAANLEAVNQAAEGAGVPVQALGGDDTDKKAPAPEASNGELALEGAAVKERYAGRRKKTNGNT